MLLACDPGVHACGMAWYSQGKLIAAGLVPTVNLAAAVQGARVLALERQYITFKHPRPQDIVDLAFAAGVVKGLFLGAGAVEIHEYKPVQWKGSVPKAIMGKRIIALLTPEEKKILTSSNHNVIDAVGIGLHALGRL